MRGWGHGAVKSGSTRESTPFPPPPWPSSAPGWENESSISPMSYGSFHGIGLRLGTSTSRETGEATSVAMGVNFRGMDAGISAGRRRVLQGETATPAPGRSLPGPHERPHPGGHAEACPTGQDIRPVDPASKDGLSRRRAWSRCSRDAPRSPKAGTGRCLRVMALESHAPSPRGFG
jgi:hypothetical protein